MVSSVTRKSKDFFFQQRKTTRKTILESIYTATTISLTSQQGRPAQYQYLAPGAAVSIYADTVTIDGVLALPSTNVKIVARQLLCAAGQVACAINTSGGQDLQSFETSKSQAKPGAAGSYVPTPGSPGTDGEGACRHGEMACWAAGRSVARRRTAGLSLSSLTLCLPL